MPKAKISVSLEVDLIVWLDEQVEKGVCKNRSQGVEHAIKQMKEEEKP